MQWPHELAFDRLDTEATFARLAPSSAVYALYGREAHAEPYIGRTPDLRRRLRRLLTPSAAHPRRLHLAGLVARIAWAETTSELQATLLLYQVSQQTFGERTAKRMHLRTPGFLRLSMSNPYPRLYVTTSITHAAAAELFGPFASRAAADRYAEQVLDLFLLRHCPQELDPDPNFPGCIYSEMKKCLAPCYAGCTDARYAEEAGAVRSFLSTGGRSLLATIAGERDAASAALDFERAAAAHVRLGKVEVVAALAAEAARALADQHAVLVLPGPGETEQVALYLLHRGSFSGPVAFSVFGMRHPNEQSGSSSLFAHPVAFAPVVLVEPQSGFRRQSASEPGSESGSETGSGLRPAPTIAVDTLEQRLQGALTALEDAQRPASKQQLCDHLSIFARWYYRPQAKREGEVVFFPPFEDKATTPAPKLLLRAISRVWRAAQAGKAMAEEPPAAGESSAAASPQG